MKNLKFIKGLVIGSVFSAMFWVGTYQAVSTLMTDDSPQEQVEPTSKIIPVRASL